MTDDNRRALLTALRRVAPAVRLPAVYDNLTPSQRHAVREAYAKRQDGLCSYCFEPLDDRPHVKVRNKRLNRKIFPKGFFDHPVHLHHSHDTGLTIGAVHAVCNAVLWVYHRQ